MAKGATLLGFVNVSKPANMTSHDVVARLRKLTGIQQVGHGGTLDPAATGVLPIALGGACRLLRFLSTDKIYRAEFLLGTRTDTDDLAGEVLSQVAVPENVDDLIGAPLAKFTGTILQTPPAYSAIHHNGKRLYELARSGNLPSDLKQRQVTIESIDVLTVQMPVLQVRIKCSGGTYIRAIARDLGEELGCGACLISLVREKSGPFWLTDAHLLEELEEIAAAGRLSDLLVMPEKSLAMDVINVDRSTARRVALGQCLPLASLASVSENQFQDDKLCLVVFEQALVALCSVTEDSKLHPEVVVTNANALA